MAERHAGSCFGVFLESGQTTAPSGVLFRLAIGVGSARQSLARVNATALDAGQLPVTVIVGLAFGSSFPSTSILIGVAGLPAGTTTLEAAVLVDAHGSWTARIISALVNVAAADRRIPGVTRLAHALGRIRRSALAVDSASVALAGALALVVVFRVGVVRRRANALARLDAAFVGSAFRVGDASHLARSANAFVRIAGEIGWALAVETARKVEAFGSESASGLPIDSFLTFVDILAGSIRSGTIAGRASAVADSAGHGDAFGSGWTGLFAASAIGQETSSSDYAIRRLAAAFDTIAEVAALERIAFVAFGTGAVVTSWQILTNGPEATSRLVGR